MPESIAEDQRLKKFPRGFTAEDQKSRQQFLENYADIDLQSDKKLAPDSLKGIIENQIGYMSIPMGMAGPLILDGNYASGKYFIPLCTVEGTLVASMTRGMQATSKGAGIKTSHLHQRMSRAPIFFFEDIRQQSRFVKWIKSNEGEIRVAAESTTRYGKLTSIDTHQLNKYVILEFAYETGNACGQNMVSKATMHACELIRQKTDVTFILDSNFSGDKKASGATQLKGRGHHVSAQTFLSDQVIDKVLGTSAAEMYKIQEFGPYVSTMANSNGIQLHLSNALTAIYMATGQDVACVAENAVGYTQMEITDGGMEFMLTMPSISVGTVGGGTRLPQQQQCLKLLDCHEGEFASRKLSEIICASALCLEISLIAAIVSEKWVGAHMRYGRNKS